MKNVEIILFVYRNLVFGKSLYVDSRLIGKFMFKNGHHARISSMGCPDLDIFNLYLIGDTTELNDYVLLLEVPNANVFARTLIEDINIINSKSIDELLRNTRFCV